MGRFRRAAIAATSSAAIVGMTVGAASLVLADRFVRELTKPGEVIDPDAPVWGGWCFPALGALPPEELRRPVTFFASDGTRLQGEFWAQPEPAPTIILSHGFRLPCVNFRPIAALEYRDGCNVLLFDYRGHGDSAIIPTSGGNAEVRDLAAAVRLAAYQPETLPGSIFIHGFSMGAAVALLLPPHPAVVGIIADSPFARLDDMLQRIITSQLRAGSAGWPLLLRPLRAFIPACTAAVINGAKVIFRVRFRHPLVARPEARLRHRRAPTRTPPLLIFHTTDDPLIPLAHAERIARAAQAAGTPVETHYAASAIHCGAYAADPAAYIAHLRAFVERYRPHPPTSPAVVREPCSPSSTERGSSAFQVDRVDPS
jgi:alpha-beta hydrolase superfamily lysophospholipase